MKNSKEAGVAGAQRAKSERGWNQILWGFLRILNFIICVVRNHGRVLSSGID